MVKEGEISFHGARVLIAVFKPHQRDCLLRQNSSLPLICATGIHTIPLENTFLESVPFPHVKHCHLHSQ